MPDINLAAYSVFVPPDPFEDHMGPIYYRLEGDARQAGSVHCVLPTHDAHGNYAGGVHGGEHAGDLAGNREIVDHEREALLFPVGDVDRLAEAVSWLAREPLLRAALVERGYRRVMRELRAEGAARTLALALEAEIRGSRAAALRATSH